MNWSLAKYGIEERDVKEYARRVEKVERELATRGEVYPGTVDEIKRLSKVLYRRLVERRILDQPQAEFWTLDRLRRAVYDAKEKQGNRPRTLNNLRIRLTRLEEFFGAITLDKIDADAARQYDDYLASLIADGTLGSSATRDGYIAGAKTAFNWAVKSGIVAVNPFDGIKKGDYKGNDRKVHVSLSLARAIMEACHNSDSPLEWRALFTLGRFQGLRIPSEPRALRWQDVDFERGRITITSQKTKNYEGKGRRVMPLFKPTADALKELRESQPKNQVFVFADLLPRMRLESNLRTPFIKILKRAGIDPYPVIFHSLRGTCQKELTDKYPAYIVCIWLGNSPQVAAAHYLHVTSDDLEGARGFYDDWNN